MTILPGSKLEETAPRNSTVLNQRGAIREAIIFCKTMLNKSMLCQYSNESIIRDYRLQCSDKEEDEAVKTSQNQQKPKPQNRGRIVKLPIIV